jgi:hypothetical protein
MGKSNRWKSLIGRASAVISVSILSFNSLRSIPINQESRRGCVKNGSKLRIVIDPWFSRPHPMRLSMDILISKSIFQRAVHRQNGSW